MPGERLSELAPAQVRIHLQHSFQRPRKRRLARQPGGRSGKGSRRRMHGPQCRAARKASADRQHGVSLVRSEPRVAGQKIALFRLEPIAPMLSGQDKVGVGPRGLDREQVIDPKRPLARLVIGLRSPVHPARLAHRRLVPPQPIALAPKARTNAREIARNIAHTPVDLLDNSCNLSGYGRESPHSMISSEANPPAADRRAPRPDPARVKAAKLRLLEAEQKVTDWARAEGEDPEIVHKVLSGRRACASGASRRIAVKLGILDGERVHA